MVKTTLGVGLAMTGITVVVGFSLPGNRSVQKLVNCTVGLLSSTGTVILLTMGGTTVLEIARYRVFTSLFMVRSVGESVCRKEKTTGGVINQKDGMMTLTGTTALLTMIETQGMASVAMVVVIPVGRVSSGAGYYQNIIGTLCCLGTMLKPGTTAALLYLETTGSTLQPRQYRD